MKVLKKVFSSEIKGIDEKEQTITAYVSTNAIDRMKEVLDPEGVDLSHYKKNPVVLWAHDYSKAPIAKALWIKRDGNGLMSKMKFADTEFAQEIFKLYQGGFLKTFSVGFIPKETEWGKEEDRNNPKKPRLTYKRWEMLEYSAVPVPANPEALALAMQKGILKSDSIKDDMQKGFIDSTEDEEDLREFNLEEDNKEVVEEKKVEEIKVEENNSGLDDLLAENKILSEKVETLEKENNIYRYKIYELLNQSNKKLSEIAVDVLAEKTVGIINGAIRKAQGKLD